ncbi:hypothetical protein [Ferroacidibacillus organovorans]|uniref:Uncharacterized protein n=1 Tax=Ferroacidibacillus organovorans TaxID=1765683 RepID=A0A853KDU3_9BACL|nr:hypothetical protein [Ferroacidibacillus organovorans]KYP79474.1 hypothetical protein AYJ22_04185 [Ferroacidibacillus organovorans]OAG94524.1 hypothetical protein AYW79_04910 [Ferroacidibacillus organovorans]
MKNVQTKDSLKNLRHIAERTIAKDLDVSQEFRDQLLTKVHSISNESHSRQIHTKWWLVAIITLTVVFMGVLTITGVLRLKQGTPKIESTVVTAALASLPMAAATLLQKTQYKDDKHFNLIAAFSGKS